METPPIFILTGEAKLRSFLLILKSLDPDILVSKAAFILSFVGSPLYPTLTSEENTTPPKAVPDLWLLIPIVGTVTLSFAIILF